MIRDDDEPAKIRLYVDLALGAGTVLEPSSCAMPLSAHGHAAA